MRSRTLSWFKRCTPVAVPAREAAPRPQCRPHLDALEDRTVLSVTPLVNLPVDVGPVKVVTNTVNNQPVQQLQAPVMLGGQQAGTLVMDATSTAAAQSGACGVLDLHLNAIHLNLLGLHVDTSDICLDVTGNPNGGLLGQLVCGLGNNANVASIIDQLNGPNNDLIGQVNTFLTQLEGLLDGALGQAMQVTDVLGTDVTTSAVTTHQAAQQGNCDILNLSLGPVDLNLLGLNVAVDNCANGPVTVDVTADPNGGLVGGLLCGLADGNLAGLPINRVINRLDRLIDSVGNLADRLDEIAGLPDRFERIADRLVDQVQRVANKADSLADVDRLISRIDRVVNRLDRLIDNTDAPAAVTNRIEALVAALTRIVNRFQDLGFVNQVSAPLERVVDLIFARL